MIYIQSFFIWLYTKSPLICYNRNRVNGLEHCESSILYREGFILCYPSIISIQTCVLRKGLKHGFVAIYERV